MEKARKGIRICLFCVVIAAVVIGAAYYYNNVRAVEQISQGTLIAHACNWMGSLWR